MTLHFIRAAACGAGNCVEAAYDHSTAEIVLRNSTVPDEQMRVAPAVFHDLLDAARGGLVELSVLGL